MCLDGIGSVDEALSFHSETISSVKIKRAHSVPKCSLRKFIMVFLLV
jgi:hypothetical protein